MTQPPRRIIRRIWWRYARRYAYELCDRCGRPVSLRAFGLRRERGELVPTTYWFADNPLWNRVVGGERGVRCPECFTSLCAAQGVAIGWRCGHVGDIEG